tara:strand:- start:268 stop:486 length:219 start_codon:yes stop_codon:yes gene_type:complete
MGCGVPSGHRFSVWSWEAGPREGVRSLFKLDGGTRCEGSLVGREGIEGLALGNTLLEGASIVMEVQGASGCC